MCLGQWESVYEGSFGIAFADTVGRTGVVAARRGGGSALVRRDHARRPGLVRLALALAVALGVGTAIAVGAFRIVTGTQLYVYMIVGYAIVIVQTMFAPREIIPLAYDSGGVTTSTVTVPLVAALGLGLSVHVPGRSPLLDGFGLIALASLFPMISVMGYAQIGAYIARRAQRRHDRSSP